MDMTGRFEMFFILALIIGIILITAGRRMGQGVFTYVGVVFMIFGLGSLILGFIGG